MKTLLAILATVLLAAATLTFAAPATQMSGTAVAGGNVGPAYWCGAPICPPKPGQTPYGTYRGR